MNSGAHREAEWVLKPPSKRRQVITLDLYRLIQALSQDHLSVFSILVRVIRAGIIIRMVTINGTVSHFHLRFYCVSCKCRQPFSLNQTSPVELICKSCWHSALQSVPYTTHFRMLVFTGSRKPVFYR